MLWTIAASANAPFAHAGEFAALTTAFCWTFTALSFTAAGKRIGSLSVNLIRLCIAFILFVIYGWIFRGMPFPADASGRAWFWLSLSAVSGYVIGDLCLFRAFLVIGTRLSMLCMSLWPTICALISLVVFKEFLSVEQWFAILLTVGGVGWVVMERKPEENGMRKRIPVSGIFLGLGGAFGQAVGYILIRKGLGDYDSFAIAHIRSVAGIVGFIIVLTIIGWWPKVKTAVKNPAAVGFTSIGAFFGPFLGVSFSIIAQKFAPLGVAATIMSITPVLIIPFAVFIQKEKVSFRAIFGSVLAVAGVALLFINPDVIPGW
ncbi:MAG: DMT family transporter [Planctomycetota bacterium]